MTVRLLLLLLLPTARSTPTAGPVSFLAVGDWGGDSDADPVTPAQAAAAKGMADLAAALPGGARGVLLLGDNFYSCGVQSNASARFQETFEDVYPTATFHDLPFYVVAGNHDHCGNVQAQLDYHGSPRWHFPALYYPLRFDFTSSSNVQRSVDLLMLDTSTLAGYCAEDYPGCPLQPLSARRGEIRAAETQWAWLEAQLNASQADFLWVMGHYPVYSAGSDGTTRVLVDRLLPLLKAHGAHYVSGHDHMHEHILDEGVNMFVTGPGKMCCYDPVHLDSVPAGTLQFMVSGANGQGKGVGPKPESMESGFSTLVFDDDVQVVMRKEDGTPVWTPPPIPPRSAAAKGETTAAPASSSSRPCDIFAAGGTPCVAAHSTVRALFAAYAGPLYAVQRASDGTELDVTVDAASGFADSAAQDTFCRGTSCVFSRIYDQSEFNNHLAQGPPGGAHHSKDVLADANAGPLTVGGHRVYGLRMDPPSGYRNDTTTMMATGDEAATTYAVFNGSHFNGACCFDYGNAETDNLDDGAGTMEALYFGNAKGGLNHGGAGKGPWIMADMENALWGADKVVSNEPSINHPFVTAMVKGDVTTGTGTAGPYTPNVDHGSHDMAPCGYAGCTLAATATHDDCDEICRNATGCVGYVFADADCSGASGPICWTKSAFGPGTSKTCRASRQLFDAFPGHWAIKGGDANNGDLAVYWDGDRAPGYAPMKKQGAIVLGIGGDNSDGAVGTFYEGAITKGYSTDAADAAVQADIVAAGYGK